MAVPDWATSFLTEGFAQGPMVVWNLCMYMAVSLMGYDFRSLRRQACRIFPSSDH